MKSLAAFFLTVFTLQGFASNWKDSPELEELFNKAGVTGTFVLYDVKAESYIGHNRPRSTTRFIPASTFKITNSLIGLSVKAVKSVDDVLPYGGEPQFLDVWEKDMGLRDAIAISNVPIYQELARRIGLERMQEYVSLLHFGNENIGKTVDTFWLEGPLQISAVEQADFLAKLAQGKLAIPNDVQKSVRDIALLEQNENWKLYGKTGWQNAPNPGTGWWVGWVLNDERVYSFALNMDIQEPADAKSRVALGRACLEALGVF